MKAFLATVFGGKAKKVAISGLLIAAALALPIANLSAATVKLEGSLGVANVTAGDTRYEESVNATFDQVVKFQVYYHNMELPDSGKIADNLRVKFDIPQAPGKTQTVKATIGGTNTNVITDTVTVNLDREDAYLQFIPNSAVWKHNKGTNENVNIVEESISDAVVTEGEGLVLENAKPCYNFDATVTVLARVVVPAVAVKKEVRVKGESDWKVRNEAKPGDTLEYMISYKNIGNTNQNKVVIRDNLPPMVQYVPGTTYLKNGANPNGVKYESDNIASGGIVIGDYAPGGAGYVKFDVKLPSADKLKCGESEFRNVAIARPEGMNEYYNTAITKVNKECEPEPKPESIVCDALKVDILNNKTREVEAKVMGSAQNTTITGYKIDFGDGTVVNEQTAKHTYGDYGKYTIVAHVSGKVDGKDVTVTSAACKKEVEFKKSPEPQIESIKCDALKLDLFNKDKKYVKVSVEATAQNTKIDKYEINFGDGSSPVNEQTAEHTYGDYGTYKIVAKVTGMVDGKEVTDTNVNCEQTVEFKKPGEPVTPEVPELPNTGAGALIGLFGGVSLLSAVGHRMWTIRKLQ